MGDYWIGVAVGTLYRIRADRAGSAVDQDFLPGSDTALISISHIMLLDRQGSNRRWAVSL